MFLGIKPRVLIEQGKLLVFPWLAHTCHPVRVLNILFFMHVFWRECVCVRERERKRIYVIVCACVTIWWVSVSISVYVWIYECMWICVCVYVCVCVCVCINQNQQNLAILGLLCQGPKTDIVRRCWHIFHTSWSPYYYLFISWGNETLPGKHHKLGQLLPYVTNCSMMV